MDSAAYVCGPFSKIGVLYCAPRLVLVRPSRKRVYEAWPAAKQPTSSRHERYDDASRRSRKVRTCRRVAAWLSEGSARARRAKRANPEGSCVNARATRTTAKCVFFFQRVRVVRLGPGPDPRDPRRPPVVHREGCVGGIEVASVRSLACGQATHLVTARALQ